MTLSTSVFTASSSGASALARSASAIARGLIRKQRTPRQLAHREGACRRKPVEGREPGCEQLEQQRGQRVYHPVEALDAAYEGRSLPV